MSPSLSQRLAPQSKPDGLPVMKQRWAELAFFHWDIDPEFISSLLPKNLHIDTFDNRAWIGIVPFLMQRIRPSFLPPLPWLSWFHELNVRTYVHDDNGTPGVWFFSLDCNQPIAVEIARRFFNLPYQHATMRSQITSSTVHYQSTRKNHTAPTSSFHYPRPQSPKPTIPGSLEFFLVERYMLFSVNSKGNLFSGQVHHQPYQVESASEFACSTTPFLLNNLQEPISPPISSLIASPVNVSIYPLKSLK